MTERTRVREIVLVRVAGVLACFDNFLWWLCIDRGGSALHRALGGSDVRSAVIEHQRMEQRLGVDS